MAKGKKLWSEHRRKFNGKTYHLVAWYDYKGHAQMRAKVERQRDHLARVTKLVTRIGGRRETVYVVWVH